jgi:hypothetical protein
MTKISVDLSQMMSSNILAISIYILNMLQLVQLLVIEHKCLLTKISVWREENLRKYLLIWVMENF